MSGICLPGNNDKDNFKVKIQCGMQTIETKPADIVREGYNMWGFDSMVKEFSNPFNSVDKLADVFIYLLDKKGHEVCF